MSEYMDDWFNKTPRKINIGVELELFLFDLRTKRPLSDMDLCERILEEIDEPKIWRDYYPHQLEIRSSVHDNPDSLIKEVKELYKLANQYFIESEILVVPVPNIAISDYLNYRHCGLHIHVSSPSFSKEDYYNLAMSMYPFILSLADHTKNLESSELETSDRLLSSPHIGFPMLSKDEFLVGNEGERKYRDIILSKPITTPSRSRLLKPYTLEIRIFDTPSLFTFFEFIINSIFYLASYIKLDSPIMNMLSESFNNTERRLRLTRVLSIEQRYGVNKIFRKLNSEVCEFIANKFNFNFPSTTQFEFREERNISSSINGFLSMAMIGGWLE